MVLIGITPELDMHNNCYKLNQSYVEAILTSGGTPVIVPITSDIKQILSILANLRGIVLSGGGDPDPFYFGEEPLQTSGPINPFRDQFELGLAKEALALQMPILGICRGCQIMNIAAGGSIYQDITHISNLQHTQMAPRWYPTHYISIEAGTRLFNIIQDNKIRVNSMHHQAIAKVAPDFAVSAISSDSIIEAIESNNGKAIGVQWHPEELLDTHGKKLFAYLVRESEKTV
ncbi:MAG: gamma-glutamyl-gamma-aminobutyrate hydrolase family protein [Bacillota bacterium]|nr:gamma-glutamyl-gamma-aminobutyrate hydrolase family protein [Bacillota bacterium]